MKENLNQPEKNFDVQELTTKSHRIILYNDDVNSFDFVINTLIEVCGHGALQAEQCAMIVHYNGKCTVKAGNFDDLCPLNSRLQLRGLTSEITSF